jgi:predicted enzyme related to lactoylglutathione lyase
MWTANGTPIGGVMPLPPGSPAPPHWLAYIAVPDTDAAARQAASLGGRVYHGPEDIPNVGRFAIMADPQGAVFALFTALPGHESPDAPAAVGEFSWHELMADDWKSAWTFYEAMFGWKKQSEHDMGPMGVYVEFERNGRALGGMFSKGPDMRMPANWMQYIRVDSADRVVEAVKANGGTVLNGPMEVPGGDRIAQCMDPQGAAFAIHSTK